MAPILRSSVHGHKLAQGGQSQSSEIDDEGIQSDHEMVSSDMDDEMLEDEPETSRWPQKQSSAQDLLRPLQETADRVSKQVEAFAQQLDRFLASRKPAGQQLWQDTWLLLDTYATITKSAADRVTIASPGQRQAQKNRKSLGDTSAQKQNLLLEADLWTLKAELLPCQSPDMIQDCQNRQTTALAELHQYSINEDIWSAFLEVDAIACQYEAILAWLQEWKRKTSLPLTDMDLECYDQTQRGVASWDGGNIFTQGPIKRQKISRAHPGPLEPDHGIREVHYRKVDEEPLVTHMDPDAVLRQDANLETEDDLYETSAWHASWELLRRGSSPDEIREWWRERNQLWRASALCVSGLRQVEEVNKAMSRLVNLASNPIYVDLCKEFARSDKVHTDYENAVYSIMCGQYDPAVPVCKSLDDNFFALVNGLLIERYEQFLTAYNDKVHNPTSHAYTPQPSTLGRISEYVKDSQLNKDTRAEAHQPHKYLQSMIISDELSAFLLDMGHAAAQMAYLTGQSKFLFDPDEAQVNECAQVAAQDEDIVRFAVHLQLALRPLGLLDRAYEKATAVMENNIVNYIGLLQRHAKYALLPLYTSQLSSERQPRVLGRILANVTVPKERDLQMRLMKQYGITVNRVIYTLCDYTRRTWTLNLEAKGRDLSSAKIIEYHDRIVRLRPNFMGPEPDEDEKHVVQAHEWVNYIDTKNWGMAVWLMTALYKTLLLSGRLAAAKDLCQRVELSATSLRVTGMNLSLAGLIQEPADDGPDDDMEEDENLVASPSKRRKDSRASHLLVKETTDRDALAEQSTGWAHLEHLVQAMAALEIWQDLADQVEQLPRNDTASMKRAKKQLSTTLQTLQDAMQALLEPDFLNAPTDEQEDMDLAEIRNHYLPECILAYNSALYFAGHAISRQHLVQCMDLAQQVAQNETLTKAFIESKRMQEVVTAFAFDSQALLRANEHGSGSSRTRGKRAPGGELAGRPDIWQVTLGKGAAE